QESAIRALGKIGPDAKTSVPTLIKQLENQKYVGYQAEVARALGGIGIEAKAALPSLTALARNLRADSRTREVAALAVIKIDPEFGAKENMEFAHLNVRLGKVSSVKPAARPELTNDKKKAVMGLIARLVEINNPDFGMSSTLTGHAFAPF